MDAGVGLMYRSITGVQVYMCTTGVLVYYMGICVVQDYVYRSSKAIQGYMISIGVQCVRDK
jgi:hypothetical protein